MPHGNPEAQGPYPSHMTEDGERLMDDKTRTELEAAAFRRLVKHFRAHPEVQNIDLMNLAGFCRNCLSKWYRAAAEERGLEMSYDQAREIVYRSEEHTSELQSLMRISYAVFCLQKKNTHPNAIQITL